MKTYDRMQAAFPGEQVAAEVVVKARRRDRARRTPRRSRSCGSDAAAHRQVPRAGHGRRAARTSTVAHVAIADRRRRHRRESKAALTALRERRHPDDRRPGSDGVADRRHRHDGADQGLQRLDEVARCRSCSCSSSALAFLLLLVTFRSIVIPIKAILLNLLSVGAAYGVLVLVFQNGWGEKLLGFESTGAIASWLPLFLFVVLFGLSMDYHVFILSRIREAFDSGHEDRGRGRPRHQVHRRRRHERRARHGRACSRSSRRSSMLDFKQMGVGLAAAVLIDATIVRAVLLPATMKLLGDWNWYLPEAARLAAPGRARAGGAAGAGLADSPQPNQRGGRPKSGGRRVGVPAGARSRDTVAAGEDPPAAAARRGEARRRAGGSAGREPPLVVPSGSRRIARRGGFGPETRKRARCPAPPVDEPHDPAVHDHAGHVDGAMEADPVGPSVTYPPRRPPALAVPRRTISLIALGREDSRAAPVSDEGEQDRAQGPARAAARPGADDLAQRRAARSGRAGCRAAGRAGNFAHGPPGEERAQRRGPGTSTWWR